MIILGKHNTPDEGNDAHFKPTYFRPRPVRCRMADIQINRDTEWSNASIIQFSFQIDINIVIDFINISIPGGSENEKTWEIDQKIQTGTLILRMYGNIG